MPANRKNQMTGEKAKSIATFPSANAQRFLLIGNPGSRRVVLFQDALRLLGMPQAKVIPYIDLMMGRRSLAAAIETGMIVKVESPGKDFSVEKQILALGDRKSTRLNSS